MFQNIILPKYNNKLEEQFINIFHSSGLPLYFNKTGNKEFTNYQRVSIIILFQRSKKSIRDFIVEFTESKWISWLGLKKIPKKSTLHDWLKLFDMKIIRNISKMLLPNKIELTSIDGTGFDSWQRSRHYKKKAEEIGSLPHMPYAKADLFIDVKTQIVLDFNFMTFREHDVKGAEKIFKRNKIKRKIKITPQKISQTFFYLTSLIYPFRTKPSFKNFYKRGQEYIFMKQAIILRRDLKLPAGKAISQGAHASVEAVLKSSKEKVKEWRNQGMAKIVLKVENLKELEYFNQFAKDAGLITALITDAGTTTIKPGTVTCLAIGPDKDEKIDKIVKNLKLY